MPSYVLAADFHSPDMKQLQCPSIGNWVKKGWYIHSVEYYWATKRKEMLPFARP